MKCPYCLGTSFTKGQYDLAQVVAMQPVLIRNVPAHRCNQCGYLQVAAPTMKRIEKLLGEGLPNTMLPAAVYELSSPVRGPRVDYTPPMRVETNGSRVAA